MIDDWVRARTEMVEQRMVLTTLQTCSPGRLSQSRVDMQSGVIPSQGKPTDIEATTIAPEKYVEPGALLDLTRDRLLDDDVHGAMDDLYKRLDALRAQLPAEEWKCLAATIRDHDLHKLLLHSPFTRHAFEKPRGYPGDAGLIDLIYGCGPRPRHLTTLGERLYSWEFESPGCRGVRHRRTLLAREIDTVAAVHSQPRVLSVACGHLREAELSLAVRERRALITALDPDSDSIACVAAEYEIFGVTAVAGTVVDVLRRRLNVRDLLLVYAAGLYDYLATDLAAALTVALFRMLAPQGRLLIANFTPDTRDAGFMEACMDWHLIYREERQILELARRIPRNEIEFIEQFRGPDQNIAYMRVARR